VVGFQRLGGEIVHIDYRNGAGVTLRFGDGEFGRPPDRGSGVAVDDSFFQATYRLGNGAHTNVPADAITRWNTADVSLAFITGVRNPLPTHGGQDAESIEDVKKLAPQAFRAITYRAVRPEDYAEAAERLPWVARAGASFRWTGSWLSAFVTADPKGQSTLSEEQRVAVASHVDRFRQAGREVIVLAPRYADLDLEIVICVEPSSYPGDVAEAVLTALFGKRGVFPTPGFFHPDRFTFGTPLDRSELEAAVQRVPGVRAVENVRIRRRAVFDWRDFLELSYLPARDEVIRVDNDPLHPDRGTLRLNTDGGA
jgi:predicted phage baseplate assembly protein